MAMRYRWLLLSAAGLAVWLLGMVLLPSSLWLLIILCGFVGGFGFSYGLSKHFLHRAEEQASRRMVRREIEDLW